MAVGQAVESAERELCRPTKCSIVEAWLLRCGRIGNYTLIECRGRFRRVFLEKMREKPGFSRGDTWVGVCSATILANPDRSWLNLHSGMPAVAVAPLDNLPNSM